MDRKRSLGALIACGMLAACAPSASWAGMIAGETTTAEYFFNGTTGDYSGNGHNGTVTGTTDYTAGPGGREAFAFNGSTFISTNATDVQLGLNSASWTVDAWVNFSDVSTDRAVFGNTGGGYDATLHLQERNTGTPAIMMGFYSNDLQPNAPAISANTWYNVAWVFDATSQTQSIYLDGNLVASRNAGADFLGTTTAYIGQDCCGSNMAGAISNLFVFNSALSQSQIQAVAAVVPEPSSLVLAGAGVLGLLGLIAAGRFRRAR